MNEIQKRAKRYLDVHGYSGLEEYQLNQESQYTLGDIMDEIEIGYICGANEQRELDIEKVCKWLNNLIWWTPFLEMCFRKAMEGDGGQ